MLEQEARMEAKLRQMDQELRDVRARADAEVERLQELGLQSQQEAQAKLQAVQQDARRENGALRVSLTEAEAHISSLEKQLQDNGLLVESLRETVNKRDTMVRQEHQRVEELENEKEATARAIWLRKYDPASPRKFRTGDDAFSREKESDPVADTSGVYAGQVGFEKF